MKHRRNGVETGSAGRVDPIKHSKKLNKRVKPMKISFILSFKGSKTKGFTGFAENRPFYSVPE